MANDTQILLGLVGLAVTVGIAVLSFIGKYMIKALDELRDRVNELCERVTSVETKGKIYHPDGSGPPVRHKKD